jgi:predicted nucleic acid-binding protein
MIHIFIDTDIILDFLGDRKPFSKYSAKLFLEVHNNSVKLYTSSNSITTAYYMLGKIVNDKQARELIVNLLEFINIIPVTDTILNTALKSDFKDFEDAVQHYCALTNDKIKLLITRNLKDYKKSQIKTLSPEQFFVR